MRNRHTLALWVGMPSPWALSLSKPSPTQPGWMFSSYPLQTRLPPFSSQLKYMDVSWVPSSSGFWLASSGDEQAGDKGPDARVCTPPPDATGGSPNYHGPCGLQKPLPPLAPSDLEVLTAFLLWALGSLPPFDDFP